MKILVALFLLAGAAGLTALAPQSALQPRLASIQVKGNQRYSLEDIEKLTGLQIGKPVSASDLTAAANQLSKT
ncbi:MAG: POTRA domain-containing protein, partial [Vicinamibacterales bacterium]